MPRAPDDPTVLTATAERIDSSSPMPSDHYVIRGGFEGRERLRILARVMQPSTRSLLERAGVGAGMACLDVGCGGGDVTFELARLVGTSGRVVGMDMDASKIELARREAADLELAGVEFRLVEVGESAGAPEFDVVYARFLLTHLSDPADALERMLGFLRPGGVAIVEDIDFRGHFCHPEHLAFRRYVTLYSEVVRAKGADPDIGPRLPGLLRDAGLENVQMHVVQPAGFEGDVKLIAALTLENIADAVLAADLTTEDDLQAAIRELYAIAEDRTTVMSVPRVVQAWGTRPVV
jgi:SAM-dependent methyltransferase